MEHSIYLAKVIGLVSVIASLAILARYKRNIELEIEVTKIPGLTFLAGFGILVLGALMVVSHNIWVADWRVVITILSWSVLLKGTGRIFVPEAVKYMIEKKRTVRWFILGEIVLLLVGLFLMYQGFVAPKLAESYKPGIPDGVACTMDAKMCADGSYVGRGGPKCEFSKCPNEI
ncbi:MAG: hypothetical protein Q7S83_00815 [bacterium]|nr:hypothetical protein [bacterium]